MSLKLCTMPRLETRLIGGLLPSSLVFRSICSIDQPCFHRVLHWFKSDWFLLKGFIISQSADLDSNILVENYGDPNRLPPGSSETSDEKLDNWNCLILKSRYSFLTPSIDKWYPFHTGLFKTLRPFEIVNACSLRFE